MSARSRPAIVILATAAAVVAALILMKDSDGWAPAIGIGFVVVVAELALLRDRRRAAKLGVAGSGLREREPSTDAGKVAPIGEPRDLAGARNPIDPDQAGNAFSLTRFESHDRRRDDPQCPNCGRFDVIVAYGDESSSFRCGACHSAWSVAKGAPWPDVRVVADLRKLAIN